LNSQSNIFPPGQARIGRFHLTNLAGWLGIFVLAGGWPAPGQAQETPPLGPAYQKFDLTLEPGTRTEIGGPLYYQQQAGTENTEAWLPFYSRCQDPALDSREDDFLYPLLSYERHGQEYRWQFLQLLSWAGGAAPTGGEERRFTLYPFYFYQRSANSNDNYTAVAPFYGHIKNRLMLNDVTFVMFPLYSETRKRDVVTDNYLYPIFDVRRGDHLTGWQFWPLLGREHKDSTSVTNGFGDVFSVPGHDRTFALWPVYYHNTEAVGTTNPAQLLGVIPFYAQTRSPARDSTTVLWPFFSWIDDRASKYHEWEGPWPLVIYARGESRRTSRVWPLFNHSSITNPPGDAVFSFNFGDAAPDQTGFDDTNTVTVSDSFLWPLYQFHGYHAAPLEQNRTRMMFYLYENTVETNTLTGTRKRRVDMWPFFTWHHDYNGNERLQILSILEPFLPDNPRIERNWSPLWALWRAENNPRTGATSRSLLWNLFRRDSAPGHDKVSCLFGLYRYEAKAGGKSLRLFYVPVLRASAK